MRAELKMMHSRSEECRCCVGCAGSVRRIPTGDSDTAKGETWHHRPPIQRWGRIVEWEGVRLA